MVTPPQTTVHRSPAALQGRDTTKKERPTTEEQLQKQAKKKIGRTVLAFEKHNPAADVVRCPRGRSDIRRRLDAYARAAVYLPFRDTIIYDSLFGIMPISFGPGMQENIRQWKKEAEQFPLITSL